MKNSLITIAACGAWLLAAGLAAGQLGSSSVSGGEERDGAGQQDPVEAPSGQAPQEQTGVAPWAGQEQLDPGVESRPGAEDEARPEAGNMGGGENQPEAAPPEQLGVAPSFEEEPPVEEGAETLPGSGEERRAEPGPEGTAGNGQDRSGMPPEQIEQLGVAPRFQEGWRGRSEPSQASQAGTTQGSGQDTGWQGNPLGPSRDQQDN